MTESDKKTFDLYRAEHNQPQDFQEWDRSHKLDFLFMITRISGFPEYPETEVDRDEIIKVFEEEVFNTDKTLSVFYYEMEGVYDQQPPSGRTLEVKAI